MRLLLLLVGISFVVPFFFAEPVEGTFAVAQSRGEITCSAIDEASGLACSRNNPGSVWVHNDSGDEARFFLLDSAAHYKATYYLQGVMARDWEDMDLMQRDGKNYLMIGDIGDNFGLHPFVYLHCFEEPTFKQAPVDTIPQNAITTYTLRYDDGPRDAESLFYDPKDHKVYVISKRDLRVGVYEAVLPKNNADTLILHRRISLPYTFITGAAISPDGNEVLIKNLLYVYYWKRKPGESIIEMFKRKGEMQAYDPEPQGEAIAFATDSSGYFTTSESLLGLTAHLNFYRRKVSR